MHFYYITNEFINYYNEFRNGRPQWRTQDFSMGGGFQYCNDVKVLHHNYSSLEVLKCIVL